MTVLNLKQLSVDNPTDSRECLLNAVNCNVNSGEILGVIGPNGAGKSSLLKAIAGDWQYRGELQMPGINTEAKLRARQLAVLPQLSLLNFPFRVSEVVGLSRIPHQTGVARDQQIISAALEMMDIEFLQDRLYTELSGGEKQRVQLARVFAQIWDTDDIPEGSAQAHRLLLLDEPTTALDMGHQQDLMRAIGEFAKRGVAVVMVMHDINLAARYCDQLLALLCSESISYGTPQQVVNEQNIKRLFGLDVKILPHPADHSPVVVGL